MAEYGYAVWYPQFHNILVLLEGIENGVAHFLSKQYGFNNSITSLHVLYQTYFISTAIEPKILLLPPQFVSKSRVYE